MMAEPPAKRQRRIDSKTMWDANDRSSTNTDLKPNNHGRDRDDQQASSKEDGRTATRGDRRQRSRSRSRDRHEGRPDRSRNGGHDRAREGRDDRDRYKGRGDDSRTERRRTRSRSPLRNGYDSRNTRRHRSRSPPKHARDPPRGPRADRTTADARSKPSDKRDVPAANATATTNASSGRPDPTNVNGARDKMDVDAPGGDDDEEEQQMKRIMGFKNFRSTKNTKVPGNDKLYAVRKEKKIQYRQYMNRVGGFNRPLSPS